MSNTKIGKLVGKKFHKLTVINDLPNQKILVKCDCGVEKIVSKYDVYYGDTTTCGQCNIFTDITGSKFGYLTAIKRSDKRYKDGSILWECQCECGKTTYISYTRLVHYKCQSCGCKRNKEVSLRFSLTLEESASNYIYTQYVSNAKKRRIDFLLTKEEFLTITKHNCHYCNSPPSNTVKRKNFNGEITLSYSGLDRVDNSLGYIKDNCVASCKRCNTAKNDMSHDEFISLVKLISQRF